MECKTELIPRILRDIDDGVLALDKTGHIMYINHQCQELLNLSGEEVGKSYAEVFYDDHCTNKNEDFHQLIINAIYEKDQKHCSSIIFTDTNNKQKHLSIKSSFLKNEETNESIGIVVVISDITEAEVQKKKRNDAVVVFSCVAACICLYLLLLALLEFLKINVPTKLLTQVINAMVFIIGVIIYRKTDFSFDELGLKLVKPKQTFGSAIIISASIVALLVLAKLILLQINPGFFKENTPFWNWDIGLYSWISYIFTCIIQEFLARSMIYTSIRKMFDGKKSVIAAIVLSSLLFGAVHIAHGFMYMVAAIILLGSLGGLYEKQRNIWGVVIIHYILGQAACCLGFLM